MTKFNPSVCQKIIEALEHGNYRKTAAALAGVPERTFYNWIEKGKKSKSQGVYWQFWQSVKKAEEKATAWHLQQILQASRDGTWQASAWYLERKKPAEWGRREHIEHSGEIQQKHKGTIELTIHDRIKQYQRHLEGEHTTTDSNSE